MRLDSDKQFQKDLNELEKDLKIEKICEKADILLNLI